MTMERAASPEILIAEDHPLQAMLLRRLLEGEGYRVVHAADGHLALAAARERRPALVLSDVQMPGMDGYALCRALRADAALHDLTVVLLTSLDSIEDIALALECGADNFIRKPYDGHVLLARVRQLLEKGSDPDEEGDALPVRGQPAINASRRQMRDLLVSAYEEAVRLNGELQRRQSEVAVLNASLESRAAELKTANEALQAFSSAASHELRAPVQVIDGFCQVLLERHAEQLDARGRHLLGRVQANAGRMSELIDGLLSMARVTLASFESQDVDLTALAMQVVSDLCEVDGAAAGKVEVASGLRCQGDPRLLRQLLWNLVGNAWKFSRLQPAPRVQVGMLATQPGEPSTFFVTDNGVGFDPDYADKLFVDFQRLHANPDYPGTGIGLATVRRIAAVHGGSVSARSRPGETSFFFVLPGPRPA